LSTPIPGGNFRWVFLCVFFGAFFCLVLDGAALLWLPPDRAGVQGFEAACTAGFAGGFGACFGLFGGKNL
jgi:hypothetical protein